MHLAFALPPPAETGGGGGADYIHGLAGGLRSIGVEVDLLVGIDPVFPTGSIAVIDGMLLPRLRHRLDDLARTDAVALIHHIGAAAGRDEISRTQILEAERSMLGRMRRVVTTSAPIATRLADEFGVTAQTVPPGHREVAPATPDPERAVILSVGVLTRRKGHDRLIQAVSRLQDLPWHLVIAGDSQREPAHPAELRTLADELGLSSRVSVLADPTSDRLETEWRRASVFALATRWEGYPSAIAEALQRGIPCLTTTGANADTILPSTAGAICPVDDMVTFGKCLRRFLFDAGLQADMAKAARTVSSIFPRWTECARNFLTILEQ
ncbi:MAG: glycosyltransferase [Alphaproteobacteria bacterium]|nr:MAG: glycosyltransferase [Alphaproteobacteria bacterium]